MALVLYYGHFLDHQKILSQCHMAAICFLADIDWLMNGWALCSFDCDRMFGFGGLLISCNLHGCIWWYELLFSTRIFCPFCPSTFAGFCHWLLLSLLKYIKFPMSYYISTDVLILCERVLLIFLESSIAIKAFLALWSASKFLIIVLIVAVDVITGTLDKCKDGSFGLVLIDNW